MHQQPRSVTFKTKFKLLRIRPQLISTGAFLFVFGLIGLLNGLVLESSLKDDTIPDVDYDEVSGKGIVTNGQITDIYIRLNTTDNGVHPAVISYRYVTDKGKFNSKYEILAPGAVDQMKVGDDIEVKYLDGASILNGFEPYSFPHYIFILISIPFAVIGLLLLTPAILTVRKYLHLYMYGKVYNAELVSMVPKPAMTFFGGVHRVEVEYRYKTSSGQIVLGECTITDALFASGKKQGYPIYIFVSPTNETVSCIIPQAEAIRNNWGITGVDK